MQCPRHSANTATRTNWYYVRERLPRWSYHTQPAHRPQSRGNSRVDACRTPGGSRKTRYRPWPLWPWVKWWRLMPASTACVWRTLTARRPSASKSLYLVCVVGNKIMFGDINVISVCVDEQSLSLCIISQLSWSRGKTLAHGALGHMVCFWPQSGTLVITHISCPWWLVGQI